MTKFQKYFLHPLTAVLFAGSAFAFLSHYDLLQIPYVEYITFAWIVMGYLLFSQKYDLSLSVGFFLFSLFIGYKAYSIPQQSLFQISQDQQVARKLVLLASQYQAKASEQDIQSVKKALDLPASVSLMPKGKVDLKGFDIPFQEHILYQTQNGIYAASLNGEVYKLDKKGDISKITP